jgi:hypothetical protein
VNQNKRKISIRLSLPHLRVRRFALIRLMLFIKHRLHFLEPLLYRLKTVWVWSDRRVRFSTLFIAAAILVSNLATALSPFLVQHAYALGSSESLLSTKSDTLAEDLTFDSNQQMFTFNSQPSAGASSNLMSSAGGTSTSGVSATAYVDATKGIDVTDNTNKVDFKMTPKFKLADGQRDGNRIIYPLVDADGWAVYTMTAAGPKEDIILNSSTGKNESFSYDMTLSNGLQARKEADGGIGIYGNKLFSSSISTGSAKDAALLQKARQNAPKDTLLFAIPAPTIKEKTLPAKEVSNVNASYDINGNTLTMNVTGLKAGFYPLTIDPSIYVVTAYQFMYGNNESNINFDVADKLIKKGATTGARFDSWQSTTNLPIGFLGIGIGRSWWLYLPGWWCVV